MTQPEALRLEDVPRIMDNANAELRRLSAENKLLHERHHDDNVEYTRVLVQRDALLEACRFYASMMGRKKSDGEPFYMTALDFDCGDRARAAIKAVEGEKT